VHSIVPFISELTFIMYDSPNKLRDMPTQTLCKNYSSHLATKSLDLYISENFYQFWQYKPENLPLYYLFYIIIRSRVCTSMESMDE